MQKKKKCNKGQRETVKRRSKVKWWRWGHKVEQRERNVRVNVKGGGFGEGRMETK